MKIIAINLQHKMSILQVIFLMCSKVTDMINKQ